MTVPNEAIEAAARAHQDERAKLGYSNWDELNDMGKEWRLDHMLHALTAAAPFIAAQAWDEGADSQFQRSVMKRQTDVNPYRSE